MRRPEFTLRIDTTHTGRVQAGAGEAPDILVGERTVEALHDLTRDLTRADSLSQHEENLKRLREQVLCRSVRDHYRSRRGLGEYTLGRLAIDSTLQGFPWEALPWPSELRWSRLVAGQPPPRRPPPPELRILMVSPEHTGSVEALEYDLAALRRELEGLGIVVECLLGDRATWQVLQARFMRKPAIHVLHFIGHSAVRDGARVLRLLNREDDDDPVDTAHLARSLPQEVRLVYLESCDTGRPALLASAGEQMARQVGAAVAHLHAISAFDALAISRSFYAGLLDGPGEQWDLARALSDARGAVRGAAAWWPVLFLRGGSPLLFANPDEEADEPPEPAAVEDWQVVFVGAAADLGLAKPLYEALVRAGYATFMSSREVMLGQEPAARCQAALRGGQCVLMVLSRVTMERATPPREIAWADAIEGAPGIPVYLDGKPSSGPDWLAPLLRRMGADLVQMGGSERAAGVLLGHLRQNIGAPARDPTAATRYHQRRQIDRGLGLDRSRQWEKIVRWSGRSKNTTFLLHGDRRQSLELFVQRARLWLAESCAIAHDYYEIPIRVGYTTPRVPGQWEVHLSHGLSLGGGYTPAEALAEAARSRAVFLTFDRRLRPRQLDAGERAALVSFLGVQWPALLDEAQPAHPVRLLIATDHRDRSERLTPELETTLRAGAAGGAFRFVPLPEVQMADWSHIEDYLGDLEDPPPEHIWTAIRREYDDLDHDRVSFMEIAHLLDELLKTR